MKAALRMRAALLLATLAATPATVAAQTGRAKAAMQTTTPVKDCPTVMMTADAIGQPVTAATSAGAAPALALGKIVRVDLSTAKVRYAATPGHAAATGSRGGVAAVAIDRAGRYRVELGGALWIDLVRGATALRSVAHGHGDACSRFKKWVEFDLMPGRYLVQLSGGAQPATWVAVTRRP